MKHSLRYETTSTETWQPPLTWDNIHRDWTRHPLRHETMSRKTWGNLHRDKTIHRDLRHNIHRDMRHHPERDKRNLQVLFHEHLFQCVWRLIQKVRTCLILNKYVLPFQFSLFSPVCSRAECLQAVLLLHSHQHQCGSPAGCPTVPCDASLHFSSCVPQRNHFRYVSNSSQSPWTHVPWSRLCWNGSQVSNWYLWQDCVGTSTTTHVMTSEWTAAWWRELLHHLPNAGKLNSTVMTSSCSLEIPAAKISPGVHRKSWTSCVLSHVMLFSFISLSVTLVLDVCVP